MVPGLRKNRSCNAPAIERIKALSPESRPHLTQPNTGTPLCPEHAMYMVPHEFQSWEINRPVDSGFRCANLTCAIVFIEGDDGGFYTLDAHGEVTPYP